MTVYQDICAPTPFTIEGQRKFWDRQSGKYESADMTNDNQGELALVMGLCEDYLSRRYPLHDVVTLGGAVGCRDPRVVCDTFEVKDVRPKKIYFNDLSEKMVRHAMETHLSKYVPASEVVALPGDVAEIGSRIPQMPRRVVIGVYHVEALVNASPAHGYPRDGMTEYLENQTFLGTDFELRWCRINNGAYIPSMDRIVICGELGISDKQMLRLFLEPIIRTKATIEPGALRVVSRNGYEGEFFISHWYNRSGFEDMLSASFGHRMRHASIQYCAKGMVAYIDPFEAPRGIATILNNVVGNMLPQQVGKNLKTICRMTS